MISSSPHPVVVMMNSSICVTHNNHTWPLVSDPTHGCQPSATLALLGSLLCCRADGMWCDSSFTTAHFWLLWIWTHLSMWRKRLADVCLGFSFLLHLACLLSFFSFIVSLCSLLFSFSWALFLVSFALFYSSSLLLFFPHSATFFVFIGVCLVVIVLRTRPSPALRLSSVFISPFSSLAVVSSSVLFPYNQDLSASLGLARISQRLEDSTYAQAFAGLFPKDNPKNTRFAINFFTAIGLGALTYQEEEEEERKRRAEEEEKKEEEERRAELAREEAPLELELFVSESYLSVSLSSLHGSAMLSASTRRGIEWSVASPDPLGTNQSGKESHKVTGSMTLKGLNWDTDGGSQRGERWWTRRRRAGWLNRSQEEEEEEGA